MKMNKKNISRAILHTFFELYSVRELADRVVNEIDDQNIGSVELHSSKQSGFTIRCKKDIELDDETIYETLADSISDMLDDKEDEAMDLMSDNYDQELDLEMVNDSTMREFFDLSRNGRLLIIEIDT